MLIKLKTLVVENQGYKRSATAKDIYINSDNIVLIEDYPGIESFLINENMQFAGDKFSLIKLSTAGKATEYIAFGTSHNIYAQISEQSQGKRLLND